MTFFIETTDASGSYYPTTAAAGPMQNGPAVAGNLSDVMKNGTLVRTNFLSVPPERNVDHTSTGSPLRFDLFESVSKG